MSVISTQVRRSLSELHEDSLCKLILLLTLRLVLSLRLDLRLWLRRSVIHRRVTKGICALLLGLCGWLVRVISFGHGAALNSDRSGSADGFSQRVLDVSCSAVVLQLPL